MRWTVERTNSWLTNYGQLRRNTDRNPHHRLAQLALAITFIITIKLIDWKSRWRPHQLTPIRGRSKRIEPTHSHPVELVDSV